MCAAAATRGALAFKGVSRVTVSFHALDVMSDEQVGQLAAALAAAGGVAALDTQPLADRSAPPEGMEDLLEEYEEEGDAEAVDKLWRRQDREYREHGRVGHKLAAFVAAIPSLSGLDVTGLAAGLLNEPGDSDHELDWEDVEEARRNPHLQRVRCRGRRCGRRRRSARRGALRMLWPLLCSVLQLPPTRASALASSDTPCPASHLGAAAAAAAAAGRSSSRCGRCWAAWAASRACSRSRASSTRTAWTRWRPLSTASPPACGGWTSTRAAFRILSTQRRCTSSAG
jgi:hypothetical protein